MRWLLCWQGQCWGGLDQVLDLLLQWGLLCWLLRWLLLCWLLYWLLPCALLCWLLRWQRQWQALLVPAALHTHEHPGSVLCCELCCAVLVLLLLWLV